MVRGCLAGAIVIACSLPSLSDADAGPRAVIELFTSQGCSSCPPADKLLGQFAVDPSLVAISLPIDYWDYLGWKDTLADPRNTALQRGYSHARGDREVYTPQAVVNGSLHAVGSDHDAIEQAIFQSRKGGMALSLPVSMTLADGRILVAAPDNGETRSFGDAWICGLARTVTVAIGRGENRGKTITYHNVARRWVKLGTWAGKAAAWNVPMQELEGDGIDAAAVMVQTGTLDKPGTILGATIATLH
jgi:hypothetical protein